MSSFAMLPKPLHPPHDPTSVDLNAHSGWRAQLVDPLQALVFGDETVTLAPDATVRRLDETSGSLGGIVPSRNMVVASDGGIYLLDVQNGIVKRFDACDCAFLDIPCTGGIGNSARQVRDAHAIAISRGNLLICDTGNKRISVFTLQEFALRAHWRAPLPTSRLLPADSPIVAEWQPVAIATDAKGRVFVADSANGCVHRFSPNGRWLGVFGGVGDVAALAVDCSGRLYVQLRAHSDVHIYDALGQLLQVAGNVTDIASNFASMHVEIDADGNVLVDDRCRFGVNGETLSVGIRSQISYVPSARYVSAALDSAFHRCQWHRVVLTGCVPSGASVSVATYSAEIEFDADVIAALPLEAWSQSATARAMAGEWDCLIRAPRGRFLWLQLNFASGGLATPCLENIRVEFPRVSLRRYLPAVFGEDPSASEFTDRFLAIIDTTFRSVELQIDLQARLFDPRTAPAQALDGSGIDFLSWLGSWVGLSLDRHLPEGQRRRLLQAAPALYQTRGTRTGLWRLLLAYLGLPSPTVECDSAILQPQRQCRNVPTTCASACPPVRAYDPPPLLLEHFQLRRWLFVGAARLGDDARLWGRRVVNRSALNANAQADRTQLVTTPDPYHDPFRVYASRFTVFVPACIGQDSRQRKGFEQLLRTESPAHARYDIEYVQPRFRIGVQSMIGLDAVVGRYPAGVTVQRTTLGRDSVLGERKDGIGSDGRVRPSLRIGSRSQVGTTTRLD
ncbi:MAG: phage tail protein [Gemmatimonas sp.]